MWRVLIRARIAVANVSPPTSSFAHQGNATLAMLKMVRSLQTRGFRWFQVFSVQLIVSAMVTPLVGAPPDWAQEAIWYQIFVERFRNGDANNDPRPDSMRGAYPGHIPRDWAITPWGHDWYQPDPWAHSYDGDFYKAVAARRYGGDLQGVIDQLDYLQTLGVTAIYFNPLNDAPSLHKYDARNYRHIDRHLGPDPDGDAKLMAGEEPDRPETWQWTAADRMFLQLIEQLHRRNMRLILDYSWNHTGTTFWAWRDLVQHQADSRYRDWYEIESFDDLDTEENEFRYHGWLGVATLPELKKTNVTGKRPGYTYEGNLHPSVKRHVYNVTRRWLDPNGDGDSSDGVDGFRLDVAPDVPLGFWRDYVRFVRKIRPDAFLVGEAWWTKWPDRLMDPRPFLQPDMFDSVMHYQWYKPARKFFAQADGGLRPSEFVKSMNEVYAGYSPATTRSLMNLAASHDSPRLASSFQNKFKYKYRMSPKGNERFDTGPPTIQTRREIRSFLLHQFTFVSAPHIWNGDELGMWGGDDPDCRKPLLWNDIKHQPQRYRADGTVTEHPIEVRANMSTHRYYRDLIALRKRRRELSRGSVFYLVVGDEQMTLAYERGFQGQRTIAAFNRADEARQLELKRESSDTFRVLIESTQGCVEKLNLEPNVIRLTLAPNSAVALGNVDE